MMNRTEFYIVRHGETAANSRNVVQGQNDVPLNETGLAQAARLAERLGISRQHVYCAGDEANDLSMLTWAAEGFAPANCVPAVRACGATIVADADHDTLADIVSRLDKMYA